MSAGSRASTDRPLSAVSAASWTIGLWLVEQLCVALTASSRPAAATDIVSLSACIVLSTSIVVFAMVRLRAPEQSLRAALGLRKVGPLGIVLPAAVGAGLCPVLSALDDRIAARWPYDDAEAVANMHQLVTQSSRRVRGRRLRRDPGRAGGLLPGHRYEELVRAGAGDASTRWRARGLAILVTAILFAAFSLDWQTMPSTLLLGLALAWIRTREGSLVAAIAAHLGFWAIESLPILRGGDPAADVTYAARWILVGAGAAILALATIYATSRGEPRSREAAK